MENKYCQLCKDFVEEYIELLWEKYNEEIVEILVDIREQLTDKDTIELFDYYIDSFSELYSICPSCFSELEPCVIRERHDELDFDCFEDLEDGVMCPVCGKHYDYYK